MAQAVSRGARGVGLLVPLTIASGGGANPGAESRAAVPENNEVQSQSLLAPRETTDSVARIIFAQVRRGLESNGMTPQMVGMCERLVTTASGSAAVQREMFRSWEADPSLRNTIIMKLRDGPEEAARCDSLQKHDGACDGFHETRSSIQCPVCLDPLREAFLINCGGGHVLCRHCITKLPIEDPDWMVVRWLRSLFGGAPKWQRECPECRRPFTMATAVRKIGDIVESLRTHLPDEFADGDTTFNCSSHNPGDPEPLEGIFVPYWVMKLVAVVVLIAYVFSRRR